VVGLQFERPCGRETGRRRRGDRSQPEAFRKVLMSTAMLRQYIRWNSECVARFRRRGNRPVVINMFG